MQGELVHFQVNDFQQVIGKPTMSDEQIAYGFIKVANEAMCRPIRALTQVRQISTRSSLKNIKIRGLAIK